MVGLLSLKVEVELVPETGFFEQTMLREEQLVAEEDAGAEVELNIVTLFSWDHALCVVALLFSAGCFDLPFSCC